MFEPSKLAIKQLATHLETGKTKVDLLHELEEVGFTDLEFFIPWDLFYELSEGVKDSELLERNFMRWICTDNSTAIPKLMPLCLMGEELIEYVGLT